MTGSAAMMPAVCHGSTRVEVFRTFVLVVLVAIAPGVVAQPAELDVVVSDWRNERYESVVRQLTLIRREPYGKNVYVDYMLATSLCRITGMEDLGQRYFERILASYDLREQQATLVRHERTNCRAAPSRIAFETMRVMSGGGVRGRESLRHFARDIMPQFAKTPPTPVAGS